MVLVYLMEEVVLRYRHYARAFLMFVGREALAFFSLFVVVSWFEDEGSGSLSEWWGLPSVGCLLLLHSSLAVRLYHGWFGPCVRSWLWLLLGIFLGLGFVLLQFWEMWECGVDITFSCYYSVAFCTVGLHFLHVVLGVLVLLWVFFCRGWLDYYYVTLSIWYWHFVDYIWLLVFVVVYFV